MQKWFGALMLIFAAICIVIVVIPEKNTNDAIEKESNTNSITITDEDFIGFFMDNGIMLTVPLPLIPDFKKYLEEIDINPALTIYNLDYLDWSSSSNHHLLLNYGVENKKSKLTLIQISPTNEIKSTYLTDGIFVDSKVYENKAMVKIAVNEETEVVRHQLVIIDLTTMDILNPIDPNIESLYFSTPLYPITEFNWISENTIEITVPDSTDITYESLETWYKMQNPPIKNVKIEI